MINRNRLLTSAVGALVAAAIVGGVAYATVPGPDGTINGCYRISEDDQKGQLRVVNDPSACRPNEAPISWNQIGQEGKQGPQGAPGVPGTNGTNGTDGKDGVSVTTASEPAGTNCADGGVQLTAVNGVSYVCDGKDGSDGVDGTNGTNGVDGTDGQDGQNGVSVTSAVEPAGANCANGGSKFTAANGVTYACNGAPGGGGGLTGQDATSVYGTATLSVTPTTASMLVPGLTQTISVPADSVVFIATNGGLFTDNSLSTTAISGADVFVAIDGQAALQGLYRRIVCPNTGGVQGFCGWSLSAAVPLSQGSHTISVHAGPVGGFGSAATAKVSGGANNVNQGALTVIVLKK